MEIWWKKIEFNGKGKNRIEMNIGMKDGWKKRIMNRLREEDWWNREMVKNE